VYVKVVLPESPSDTVGSLMTICTISSLVMVTVAVSVASISLVLTVPAVKLSIETETVSSNSAVTSAVGVTSKICVSPAVPAKVIV